MIACPFSVNRCCKMQVHGHLTLQKESHRTSMLSDQHLERVTQYKYLGVTITDDLSWSAHVNIIASKARKLTEFLYQQFYRWSSSPTLLKLYVTLVRPHLEYSAESTLYQRRINCQKCAEVCFKSSYKSWDTSYDHLLSQSNLPRLATRSDNVSLCFWYK